MKGWLPENIYKKIIKEMPVPCVDAVILDQGMRAGICCSLPLVEARAELDKLIVGQILEVIATCPGSEEDINVLARITGHKLLRSWKEGDQFHFLTKKVR